MTHYKSGNKDFEARATGHKQTRTASIVRANRAGPNNLAGGGKLGGGELPVSLIVQYGCAARWL